MIKKFESVNPNDPWNEEIWEEPKPKCKHKWSDTKVDYLITKVIYYVECEKCGEKHRIHAGYYD